MASGRSRVLFCSAIIDISPNRIERIEKKKEETFVIGGIGNVDGEVLEDANCEVQGDSGEVSEEAMRVRKLAEPAGS